MKLAEVLGGLAAAASRASAIANAASCEILEHYAQSPVLRVLPVPGARIETLEVKLKFALQNGEETPLGENAGDKIVQAVKESAPAIPIVHKDAGSIQRHFLKYIEEGGRELISAISLFDHLPRYKLIGFIVRFLEKNFTKALSELRHHDSSSNSNADHEETHKFFDDLAHRIADDLRQETGGDARPSFDDLDLIIEPEELKKIDPAHISDLTVTIFGDSRKIRKVSVDGQELHSLSA